MDKRNKFFETVYGLQNIKRFSNRSVIVFHSPAEHCYYVALLAQFIAESENLKRAKEDQYDIAVVLAKALSHDIPESVTGDILYPIKHASPEIHGKIVELEEIAVKERLLKWLSKDLQSKFYDNIINCKEGKEGKLVAFCDQLEVMYYLTEERKLGNCSEWIDEVIENLVPIIEGLIDDNSSVSRRLYEHIITEFQEVSRKNNNEA